MDNKKIILIILISGLILLVALVVFLRSRIKDLDCSDFSNQKQAQVEFLKYRTDVYELDGNSNGIACESLK